MAILIVDDELSIREMMADLRADEGYSVQTAIDGVDALAQLHTSSDLPELIVLDLMMPRMNGWEFRAALRQDPALASIPVVVLSAHPDVAQMSQTLSVAEYLPKPIHIDRLLAIIQKFHPEK
jgi:two-component system chemotaxis response regulator CheY